MISVTGGELGIFQALEPIEKTPADASRASASDSENLSFGRIPLKKGPITMYDPKSANRSNCTRRQSRFRTWKSLSSPNCFIPWSWQTSCRRIYGSGEATPGLGIFPNWPRTDGCCGWKQYIIDHFTFNLDLDTWGLYHERKGIGEVFRLYRRSGPFPEQRPLRLLKATSITSTSISASISVLTIHFERHSLLENRNRRGHGGLRA